MKRIKDFIISQVFLLFDVLTIFLTFQLAIKIREILTPWIGTAIDYPSIERMMLICILLCLTIFITLGFYPGYGVSAVKELQQISQAIMVVYFLLMGISYLVKAYYHFSRFVLLAAFAFNLVSLPLVHFVLRNIISRFSFYGTGVHIFGMKKDVSAIEEKLKRIRRLGWKVEGVFPLAAVSKLKKIHLDSATAILVIDSLNKARIYERDLSRKYDKVIVIPQKSKPLSLWVVPRDLGGDLGLEFRYKLLTRFSIIVKQITDYVVSILAILLLSPILILSAVLIKLDTPGPIIFKQTRMGKNGRHFQMYKFRTMFENADEILKKLLSSNKEIEQEYLKYHKIQNDPRITCVGKILRRFSIDEFPQLFNILAGDMSLSGPRPYLPAEKKEMGDYVKVILRVKPGITGWWQVLGRSDVDFLHRLEMDEFYISNWSIWMDIYIFLKTFGVIVFGRGV